MTEGIFLSNQAQQCLNSLFNEIYSKKRNYMDTVLEMCSYLFYDGKKYDYILKQYENVSKELLNRMIVSNFLEITYYRIKNNIPIDNDRLNLFNLLKSAMLQSESLTCLVTFETKSFFVMLNDVLLYFWHFSQVYSYNAVKSIIEDKDSFAKVLYAIYPLAINEHMLTLEDSFSLKETLLYTFYEILINATERIEFMNNSFPKPSEGYLQRIANLLKKYNGFNPNLPNVHKEILDTFTNKMSFNNESEYKKLLMVEIIISMLRLKIKVRFPLEIEEKTLLSGFDALNKSLEDVSKFYDDNNQIIISSLLNNWHYFHSEEEILQDLPELDVAKSELQRH